MNCLITGGAGFIGSHLALESLKKGASVTVLDNLSTGRRENLTPGLKDIRLIVGDIRDPEMVRSAVKGAEVVFHCAALVAVPSSVENPILSAEINDLGALNVFTAARAAGVRRVVFSSSSAVYGDTETQPQHENMTPHPQSPYAAHKLLGEHYGAMFGDLYDFEVVSLRYFNVYGPRQDPSSPYSGVISIFLDRLANKSPVKIFGDGEQNRDFIYVADVVRANFLAAEARSAAGKAINVGTGRAVTINHLFGLIRRLLNAEQEPVHAAPRAGDVFSSRADTNLASKLLGFKAGVSFEQGLKETAEWSTRAKTRDLSNRLFRHG